MTFGFNKPVQRVTLQLLQIKFPGQLATKICYLTLLDIFLLGFLKGKVYANNPLTIAELKTDIIRNSQKG